MLIGIGAEQQIEHTDQDNKSSDGGRTERDFSREQPTNLVYHQGNAVSRNILE